MQETSQIATLNNVSTLCFLLAAILACISVAMLISSEGGWEECLKKIRHRFKRKDNEKEHGHGRAQKMTEDESEPLSRKGLDTQDEQHVQKAEEVHEVHEDGVTDSGEREQSPDAAERTEERASEDMDDEEYRTNTELLVEAPTDVLRKPAEEHKFKKKKKIIITHEGGRT